MEQKFVQASRDKLRFNSPKGLLSVEDLWDLPLTSETKANLDDIARELHGQLDSKANVSFVKKDTTANAETQLKFDIVKHIIDVRLEERNTKELEQANRARDQRILEIIEAKENEKLSSASIEELRAMLTTKK